MTDQPVPRRPVFESPIRSDDMATGNAAMTADLIMSDESAAIKLLVRAADDSAAAAQLAVRFGTSRVADDVLIMGQRPGEWLLVGPAYPVAALADNLDRSDHVTIVDHSHSRALFSITGAKAARLLEKVCSLDWSDEMTPDGAVVSASVAKVTCDIVRQDVSGLPSYRLACDRSLAQYLFDAVKDAGQEFGVAVVA